LISVQGLRVSESRARMYGIFSSHGFMTKPNDLGVSNLRPIYDWKDGDIWKAIAEKKWDYNKAYDTLFRMRVPRKMLRIAPPTMNVAGAHILSVAARAWPQWFERVAKRLPGVRAGANFGELAVSPTRRLNETWKEAFFRLCIEEAPKWIADRAQFAHDLVMTRHNRHAHTDLPEIEPCYHCVLNLGCWRNLTNAFFNGDPFSVKCGGFMDHVEPEFFRPGAGKWGGKPAF